MEYLLQLLLSSKSTNVLNNIKKLANSEADLMISNVAAMLDLYIVTLSIVASKINCMENHAMSPMSNLQVVMNIESSNKTRRGTCNRT